MIDLGFISLLTNSPSIGASWAQNRMRHDPHSSEKIEARLALCLVWGYECDSYRKSVWRKDRQIESKRAFRSPVG
jgi:hypothetical protein